mmetsp:Transcript_28081/g.71065  ORF Transcript_28081/g.71065 Transcript_28081/m.71065 type:complete len:205 (-) Transcript_28081:7-621(-)
MASNSPTIASMCGFGCSSAWPLAHGLGQAATGSNAKKAWKSSNLDWAVSPRYQSSCSLMPVSIAQITLLWQGSPFCAARQSAASVVGGCSIVAEARRSDGDAMEASSSSLLVSAFAAEVASAAQHAKHKATIPAINTTKRREHSGLRVFESHPSAAALSNEAAMHTRSSPLAGGVPVEIVIAVPTIFQIGAICNKARKLACLTQ